MSKKRKVRMTPLGKALREQDASMRSGWDSYRSVKSVVSGPALSRTWVMAGGRDGPARRVLGRVTAKVQTGAIAAARAGDVGRLVDLLRAHRPLVDEDFDELADYVEATAKRPRGRERNEALHAAAQLADVIRRMDKKPLPWGDEEKPAPIRKPPARRRHYVPLHERDYKLEYGDQFWAYPDIKKVPEAVTATAVKAACRENGGCTVLSSSQSVYVTC